MELTKNKGRGHEFWLPVSFLRPSLIPKQLSSPQFRNLRNVEGMCHLVLNAMIPKIFHYYVIDYYVIDYNVIEYLPDFQLCQ